MPKATATVSETTPAPGPDVILARGGNDAHLRLAVLLAARSNAPLEDRREALAAGTGWTRRWRAATRCLESTTAPITLVDVDALWVSEPWGEGRFDDATNRVERARVFSDVLDIGAEKGWQFVRSAPLSEVSDQLERRGVSIRDTDEPTGAPINAKLAPALRPLVRWMISTGRVPEQGFRSYIAVSPDPDSTAVEAFSDVIGPRARTALRQLSLLREEHLWNGVAGPFVVGDGTEDSVPRDALERLVEARALHVRMTPDGTLRFLIPAALRDRVATRYAWVDEPEARALRGALARKLSASVSLEGRLEAHRQAVLSQDPDLSMSTATFYGADVRLVARQLSLRAKAIVQRVVGDKLYQQAADLYRQIVSTFDEEDAYAWQYLAFNLQRAHRARTAIPARMPSETVTEVRRAYRRSCDLSDVSGFNPLFHGRRLAFDLLALPSPELVHGEFRKRIFQALQQYDAERAAWLLSAARDALQARDLWNSLLAEYPAVARALAQRRSRIEPDPVEV